MLENSSENDTVNRSYDKVLVLNTCWHGNNILPSLNNLISEAERHPMAYNKLKKQLEFCVINCCRLQLRDWKATKKVQLHYEFGERNKGVKRDYDNISASARKIVQDAMVKGGYLQDDAPKYLAPSTDEFHYVDKPYIKIYIKELEE